MATQRAQFYAKRDDEWIVRAVSSLQEFGDRQGSDRLVAVEEPWPVADLLPAAGTLVRGRDEELRKLL